MPPTNTILIHISHGEDKPEEIVTFDHSKLLLAEAIALEEETGWSLHQLLGYAGIGSFKAYRAMIWIIQKRSHPKLRPADVVYAVDQIWIEDPDLTDDELSDVDPKAAGTEENEDDS